MIEKFNHRWNAHYNFEDPNNLREIEIQSELDLKGISSLPSYAVQGGETIESPWGNNQTIAAGECSSYPADTFAPQQYINPDSLTQVNLKPSEFCSKVITITKGGFLSLQRHRGRQEIWHVTDGCLTAILNGEIYTVGKGQSLFVPMGAPHCMINISDDFVKVNELQTGVCREADNIRLLDFFSRPIYPLTSEIEHISAKIYISICRNYSEMIGNVFAKYPQL